MPFKFIFLADINSIRSDKKWLFNERYLLSLLRERPVHNKHK